MALHQYDPDKVTLVYGGSLIKGYAPQSFINVTYNAQLFTLLVGSDGEGSRSKSNNSSALIEIRLMPGSLGNLLLNGFFQADKISGASALPLVITDPSTLSVFAAESAWVRQDPGYDFQQDAQPRVWQLEAHRLTSFYGAAA